MNRSVKFRLFLLALCAMVCMALGSLFAAANHPWSSTVAFVGALVCLVLGFTSRRRLLSAKAHQL